jgi:hypothetical protein
LTLDGNYITFEIEIGGREPELNSFSKNFDSLEWNSKHIKPLGPKGMAYMGGAPAELIIFIFSLAANILSIAKILAERIASEGDTIIRIEGKEIRLKGKWTAEEISDLLSKFAQKRSKEEAMKHIAKIKSAKIREAKKELENVEAAIAQYEKLVDAFKKLPEKGLDQKRKYASYKKTLTQFQMKATNIKSFIDFLKQEF